MRNTWEQAGRNRFSGRDDARDYFTRLTGLFGNLNYARPESADYAELSAKIDRLYQSVPRKLRQ